jgi:hypothetical protein
MLTFHDQEIIIGMAGCMPPRKDIIGDLVVGKFLNHLSCWPLRVHNPAMVEWDAQAIKHTKF